MAEQEQRSFAEKVRVAREEGGWPRVVAMAWARAVHPIVLWLQRTAPQRLNPLVVARARLTGQPVVHAVGDSHTLVLSGVFPFRVTWMGAATAFSLGRKDSATRSNDKLERALTHVRSGDVVLLVLGEVDTRIHIYLQYKRRDEEVAFSDLVADTIRAYGKVILDLKARGFRVAVHSVSATPYQGNIFGVEHYADDETRALIVDEFNRQLGRWCSEHAIDYLDMYCLVRDERGFIRRELAADGTHLDRNALPLYREWVRANVSPGRAK